MTKNEIEEIFEKLKQSGLDPQLCDTAVPYFADGVPAGYPEAPGDYDGEMALIPRAFLRECSFIVSVHGDSMKDAGIYNGDDVMVKHDDSFDDGDTVVAWIDGGTTVKTYFRDDDGEAWLVPANDAFDPIRLSDHTTIYLLGRVTRVLRSMPHSSFRSISKRMRAFREKMQAKKVEITHEDVDRAIQSVAPMVEKKRQWFAVYRCLLDFRLTDAGDYDGFCRRVQQLVPEHPKLPTAQELQRMDVQSFSKPVARWDADNAPVNKGRFLTYLNIAKRVRMLLEAK